MRGDIKTFIRKVNKRFKTESYYIPENDVYVITKNGKAVQNFNSKQFGELPRDYRFRRTMPLIKVGLAHNIGERAVREQLYHLKKIGKRII